MIVYIRNGKITTGEHYPHPLDQLDEIILEAKPGLHKKHFPSTQWIHNGPRHKCGLAVGKFKDLKTELLDCPRY